MTEETTPTDTDTAPELSTDEPSLAEQIRQDATFVAENPVVSHINEFVDHAEAALKDALHLHHHHDED